MYSHALGRISKTGLRIWRVVSWAIMGLQRQPKGRVRVPNECFASNERTVNTNRPVTCGGMLIDQKQFFRSNLV